MLPYSTPPIAQVALGERDCEHTIEVVERRSRREPLLERRPFVGPHDQPLGTHRVREFGKLVCGGSGSSFSSARSALRRGQTRIVVERDVRVVPDVSRRFGHHAFTWLDDVVEVRRHRHANAILDLLLNSLLEDERAWQVH